MLSRLIEADEEEQFINKEKSHKRTSKAQLKNFKDAIPKNGVSNKVRNAATSYSSDPPELQRYPDLNAMLAVNRKYGAIVCLYCSEMIPGAWTWAHVSLCQKAARMNIIAKLPSLSRRSVEIFVMEKTRTGELLGQDPGHESIRELWQNKRTFKPIDGLKVLPAVRCRICFIITTSHSLMTSSKRHKTQLCMGLKGASYALVSIHILYTGAGPVYIQITLPQSKGLIPSDPTSKKVTGREVGEYVANKTPNYTSRAPLQFRSNLCQELKWDEWVEGRVDTLIDFMKFTGQAKKPWEERLRKLFRDYTIKFVRMQAESRINPRLLQLIKQKGVKLVKFRFFSCCRKTNADNSAPSFCLPSPAAAKFYADEGLKMLVGFSRARNTPLQDYFQFLGEPMDLLLSLQRMLMSHPEEEDDNESNADHEALLHKLLLSLFRRKVPLPRLCPIHLFGAARQLTDRGSFKTANNCSGFFSGMKFLIRCSILHEALRSKADRLFRDAPIDNDKAKALIDVMLDPDHFEGLYSMLNSTAMTLNRVSKNTLSDQNVNWEADDEECCISASRINVPRFKEAMVSTNKSLDQKFSDLTFGNPVFDIKKPHKDFEDRFQSVTEPSFSFSINGIPESISGAGQLIVTWMEKNAASEQFNVGDQTCLPSEELRAKAIDALRLSTEYLLEIATAMLITGGQPPRIQRELFGLLLQDEDNGLKRGIFYLEGRMVAIIRRSKNFEKEGDVFLPHYYPKWVSDHLMKYLLVIRPFERNLIFALGSSYRGLDPQAGPSIPRNGREQRKQSKKRALQAVGGASDEEDIHQDSESDSDFSPSDDEDIGQDVSKQDAPIEIEEDRRTQITDEILELLGMKLFVSAYSQKEISVGQISKAIGHWFEKHFGIVEGKIGVQVLRQMLVAIKNKYCAAEEIGSRIDPRRQGDQLDSLANHNGFTTNIRYGVDGDLIRYNILRRSLIACDTWHRCIGADLKTTPVPLSQIQRQKDQTLELHKASSTSTSTSTSSLSCSEKATSLTGTSEISASITSDYKFDIPSALVWFIRNVSPSRTDHLDLSTMVQTAIQNVRKGPNHNNSVYFLIQNCLDACSCDEETKSAVEDLAECLKAEQVQDALECIVRILADINERRGGAQLDGRQLIKVACKVHALL